MLKKRKELFDQILQLGRKKYGSYRQFALAIGIKEQVLQVYLRGNQNPPSLTVLDKWANLVDYTISIDFIKNPSSALLEEEGINNTLE